MFVADGRGELRFGFETKKKNARPYVVLNRHERRKLTKLLRTNPEYKDQIV